MNMSNKEIEENKLNNSVLDDNNNNFCIYCGSKLKPPKRYCSHCGKEQ